MPKACKIGLIVAGVLAVIYLGVSLFFMNRFGFRTQINGVDCSMKSPEDAKAEILKAQEDYELTVEFKDDTKETIKGSDIDLDVNVGDKLELAQVGADGFKWPYYLIKGNEIEIESLATFSTSKLMKIANDFDCFKEENIEEPVSAQVAYKKGKGFEVIPEKEGNKVDRGRLLEAMTDSIENFETTFNVKDKDCYDLPKFYSDDEEFLKSVDKLNDNLEARITYTFGSASETVNSDVFAEWLMLDKEGNPDVDLTKAAAFVQTIAAKYDTIGTSRLFHTSYGADIYVGGGNYGWYTDVNGEAAALADDIKNNRTATREVNYLRTAATHDGNDFGNSYVEINLSAQHLYIYKNGGCVLSCDIVSGNASDGHDTPPGVYAITYKESPSILVGENYRTPVGFWMPFNQDIGLHDATWQPYFGGNRYMENGSHGCINMSYGTAATAYATVEQGWPVILYHLPGTEPEPTEGELYEEKIRKEEEEAAAKEREAEEAAKKEQAAKDQAAKDAEKKSTDKDKTDTKPRGSVTWN